MELDCLAIYTLRKHESPQRKGLSNLYGPSALRILISRIRNLRGETAFWADIEPPATSGRSG